MRMLPPIGSNELRLAGECRQSENGPQITTTDYGITLSQMIDKQMKVSPQTDAPAYVSLSYINTANQTVTADLLNIRSSPL
ncbi:hypothetical protein PO124_34695 [Bacillus licheniformis]|nr:hypothetical protein [Bacillus licheniformis]